MVHRLSVVGMALVMAFATANRAQAQVITFDSNLDPLGQGTSLDAENITNSQHIAERQVNLAILYLELNRGRILAGQDTYYNSIFGDFYVKNGSLAGQYNQFVSGGQYQAQIDPLNPTRRIPVQISTGLTTSQVSAGVTGTIGNPAQYNDVLHTFEHIRANLAHPTQYELGPAVGNANNFSGGFDLSLYGSNFGYTLKAGDARFGTGLIFPTVDLGTIQWGYSTSPSDTHLSQTAPLTFQWYRDETAPGAFETIDPYAFTNEKLDIYGRNWSGTDIFLNQLPGFNVEVVGEPFLTGTQRLGSDGVVNPNFGPEPFKQYQMIISAFAEQVTPTSSLLGGGTNVPASLFQSQIIPGLTQYVGANSQFPQTFDANSYAEFANANGLLSFTDLTNLPPVGKTGSFLGDFLPQPNFNYQSFIPVIGP